MDSSGWAPERLKVFFEGDERRYSTTDVKQNELTVTSRRPAVETPGDGW